MHSIAAIAIASALSGCKKDAPPPDWAEVDCDVMIRHIVDLRVREGSAGMSEAEAAEAAREMNQGLPEMIQACNDEKATKKLTKTQYACILGADSYTAMNACMTPAAD